MHGKRLEFFKKSYTHTILNKGFTPYGTYCCGKVSCPEDSEEISDASGLDIFSASAEDSSCEDSNEEQEQKSKEELEEEGQEEAEESFLCTQCEGFVGKTQKSLDHHMEEDHHIFPLDLNAIGNDEGEICKKFHKRGL